MTLNDVDTVTTFERWYAEEYRRLLAAVTLVTDDRGLATDAVDEAFSRALADWARVGQMRQPTGWTYRVAVNHVRRRTRRRLMEHRWTRSQPSAGPVWDRDSDPDLWAAVRGLPSRQREAVILRFVVDLPEADIASMMRITRGAVSASATPSCRGPRRDI